MFRFLSEFRFVVASSLMMSWIQNKRRKLTARCGFSEVSINENLEYILCDDTLRHFGSERQILCETEEEIEHRTLPIKLWNK